MLHVVLVILHSLVAIVWFGLGLRLQTQARLVAGGPAAAAGAEGGGRTVQAMTVAAVVFYALAVAVFFVGGGFSVYGPVYHTALLLGLALVLVQVLMVQPAWGRLAGGEGSAAKRLSMAVGVGHLLWLVLFVLMFFGPRWITQWQL